MLTMFRNKNKAVSNGQIIGLVITRVNGQGVPTTPLASASFLASSDVFYMEHGRVAWPLTRLFG